MHLNELVIRSLPFVDGQKDYPDEVIRGLSLRVGKRHQVVSARSQISPLTKGFFLVQVDSFFVSISSPLSTPTMLALVYACGSI